VVVADIDADELDAVAADLGASVVAVPTDVTDPAAVKAMVEVATDEHGPVDVLVNAAGIPDLKDPIHEQSIDDWQRIVDVHLRGTYLCSKAVLPSMQERESGAIVNLSSATSFGAFPSSTAYGPAKSAINNLTKVFAVEAAAEGVRVNAVAPGFVHTPMVDPLFEDGKLDDSAILDRIPANRMAAPGEIADAISLLTDDRAGYVTGTVLPVDGGWNAYGFV
jgi:NAD(P)-dependent dehydrogenase (short-subunit alcohol dehydrogenase family)